MGRRDVRGFAGSTRDASGDLDTAGDAQLARMSERRMSVAEPMDATTLVCVSA
jgi:hypothetical protein